MTLGTKPLTSKPGEFRGICNQNGTWEPAPADLLEAWQAVLAESCPYGNAALVEDYRKRKDAAEAALAPWSTMSPDGEWGRWLPCGVDTTDRAEFAAHMAEAHNRTPGRSIWSPRFWEDGYTPTIKTRSPRPPSGGAGRPFKATAKAIADTVRVCPHCGLVAEVDDTNGARLWWDEHVRGCALAAEGVAS